MSFLTAEPSPKEDHEVDHRVASLTGVSAEATDAADTGRSMVRVMAGLAASLKHGLSKAYASSTISGSVTRTRCFPEIKMGEWFKLIVSESKFEEQEEEESQEIRIR